MMDLPQKILLHLEASDGSYTSQELSKIFEVKHQAVVGAIKSLQSLGTLVDVEQESASRWELSKEGETVRENGSYEALIFYAVDRATGTPRAALNSIPQSKIGFSKAMTNKWIALEKTDQGPIVKRCVDEIVDHVQKDLSDISALNDAQKADYKKRKLMQEIKFTILRIRKGATFTTTIAKPETDLTADMISSGSWKTLKFKDYNFQAMGSMSSCGHLHPLLKVRSEFRKIFLEMGFSEMPTNNYVESSFWNFDALFQPQQHPARDAHDTFFLSEPATSGNFPPEYLERVKAVHSNGGYGSQGYKYDWKLSEAQKNILRTHTTAVSAKQLYALAQEAQESGFKPARRFSIDRVFRNETLDATHLAEFHQVEGWVADYNLTLGHLMGVIQEFFNKLGIKKIRFKPAYNPYTEPSMEIFSYHEGLKKWVEVGNSGIFRPEMLLPMHLPEDVVVIAWGLSLERPTMIKYGIDNIRDLFGPRVNLQMVYDNSICRLDKS